MPENTVAGNALTIVIAIMSFLACLTLGAVTLVRDASRDWQLDIQREVTIQVRPIDGVDVAAEAAQAPPRSPARAPASPASRCSATEDNAPARAVARRTGLDLTDLPIPRLVVVRVADPGPSISPTSPPAAGSRSRAPASTTTASGPSRLQSMANATVFAGLSILALVFVATILSVVFATRGAMATNSGVVVGPAPSVGAEDGFIAREFQRHFLLLGLRGGLDRRRRRGDCLSPCWDFSSSRRSPAPKATRCRPCSAISPSARSAISARSASPS